MSEQHNKMSEQHNSKYHVTSYLCNEGINDLSHLQTTSYNPTQYKPYLYVDSGLRFDLRPESF